MALLGPPMPAAGRDTAPAKAFLEGAVGIARKAWPKPLEFQPRQAPRESDSAYARANGGPWATASAVTLVPCEKMSPLGTSLHADVWRKPLSP